MWPDAPARRSPASCEASADAIEAPISQGPRRASRAPTRRPTVPHQSRSESRPDASPIEGARDVVFRAIHGRYRGERARIGRVDQAEVVLGVTETEVSAEPEAAIVRLRTRRYPSRRAFSRRRRALSTKTRGRSLPQHTPRQIQGEAPEKTQVSEGSVPRRRGRGATDRGRRVSPRRAHRALRLRAGRAALEPVEDLMRRRSSYERGE